MCGERDVPDQRVSWDKHGWGDSNCFIFFSLEVLARIADETF